MKRIRVLVDPSDQLSPVILEVHPTSGLSGNVNQTLLSAPYSACLFAAECVLIQDHAF